MQGVGWCLCTCPKRTFMLPCSATGVFSASWLKGTLSVRCLTLRPHLSNRLLTKLMVVVAAHFRRSVEHIFLYLHNWLLKASSSQSVMDHLRTNITLLSSLEFSFNELKSHLQAVQRIPFVGAEYGAMQNLYALQQVWDMFRARSCVLARTVLRLLGLQVSCILLEPHTRWYMQALQ